MFRYLFVRRTDWTVFGIACLLSLVLMLLGQGPQGRVAWFLEHTLLAPAHVVAGAIDRGVSVGWENQKLRKRVTQLEIEVDALRAERLENGRLRSLLGLAQERPYDLVAARVVGRGQDRLGGSLALDKGVVDGIRPNQAVLTPEGLLGRVDRVTARGARVLTLLHRDCAVAARVMRTRVDGVLQWEFGSLPILELTYVSSQEDVRPGDLVVTSGLGGVFPRGIRVGTVAKVGMAENGLMKSIEVQPSANFRSVEEALVYLPDARKELPTDVFPGAAEAESVGGAAPDSTAQPAAATGAP